jgi:hypothetical protein
MPPSLSCYYLDEALSGDELAFVEQTLLGPWAKFNTGAGALVQKRVPAVLPLPDADGHYADSREQRALHIRRNLRHARIAEDSGRQVVWVMPQDQEWDAIFQFAIRAETGLGVFAVQRWYVEDAKPTRRPVRVINTESLMQGL